MKFKKKILIISDNLFLVENFIQIIKEQKLTNVEFSFACSFNNTNFPNQVHDFSIDNINIKQDYNTILKKGFNLIISLHCKQLFPVGLISRVKCINIHPGLNPHNRGWFPQVFSIINGLPLGATIHEIDEELDHGPIIAQKQVNLFSYDTSLTAYNRVLQAEIELIRKYLQDLIYNNYTIKNPKEEGNLNLKKDFNKLCYLNLEEQGTFGDFLNRLRALTHGEYSNAYYLDKETGNKVFVKVEMEVADE